MLALAFETMPAACCRVILQVMYVSATCPSICACTLTTCCKSAREGYAGLVQVNARALARRGELGAYQQAALLLEGGVTPPACPPAHPL